MLKRTLLRLSIMNFLVGGMAKLLEFILRDVMAKDELRTKFYYQTKQAKAKLRTKSFLIQKKL